MNRGRNEPRREEALGRLIPSVDLNYREKRCRSARLGQASSFCARGDARFSRLPYLVGRLCPSFLSARSSANAGVVQRRRRCRGCVQNRGLQVRFLLGLFS